MPSKQTENYHLSQWEPDDQVLRTDFNADNTKIDEALTGLAAADAAEAAAREALNTVLSKKGNCTIQVTTYTGKNTSGAGNETKITFSQVPTAFIIYGPSGILVGRGMTGMAYGCFAAPSGAMFSTSPLGWTGPTLSMSVTGEPARQMNLSGTHYVIYFTTES